MRKLKQVAAFWRNDQPTGVGLSISSKYGDLEEIMCAITEHWELMYRDRPY